MPEHRRLLGSVLDTPLLMFTLLQIHRLSTTLNSKMYRKWIGKRYKFPTPNHAQLTTNLPHAEQLNVGVLLVFSSNGGEAGQSD